MAGNAEVGTSRTSGGARVAVQKFGTFLSGMIMPNIAAFIAWGFITAFFIEKGWIPVEGLGGFGENAAGEPNIGLVGPMITFMLPLLIAIQGGRMVYGVRGGVVAVVATMGVIVGTDIPMFLGAMIMGPFAAWCMKHVDKLWEGKIKPGFEMLVNNFSAGIVAAALAVVGYFLFGPPIETISNAAGNGVDWLVDNSLLPLASLIIEPAKVLFLNNALNHGVLTPLGIQQATENGKSILFLLEANPGPGAGLLIAYAIFGTGVARNTAPAALIIQFFGGIHEIYFPFVLLKPITILATIAGGMVGILTLVIFGAGLRAPAAPGSIIAVYAQTPGQQPGRGDLVGPVRRGDVVPDRLGDPAGQPPPRRGGRPGRRDRPDGGHEGQGELHLWGAEPAGGRGGPGPDRARVEPIRKIVFACDAGMGSSAMGASVLRNKLKKAGFEDVSVVNVAIANLEDSYDLVVTHQDLTLRARDRTPSAQHVSVTNFMASPKYDEIVQEVQQTNTPQGTSAPS